MAKVKFKYAVPDYYSYWKYHTKTINIDLPKDDQGYILFGKIANILKEHLKKQGIAQSRILWLQVL